MLRPYGGDATSPDAREPDWRNLAEIEASLNGMLRREILGMVLAGARSYASALRMLTIDIEAAYLMLIQALECVSDRSEFSEEELFGHDTDLMEHIKWFDSIAGGDRVAKYFKGRLPQINRTVQLTVKASLGEAFFSDTLGGLRVSEIDRTVSSAYALRSQYVHSGAAFGPWIEPKKGRAETRELVDADFVDATCETPDLRRVLRKAPTFLGLERLTREVILQVLASRTITQT